MLNNCSRFHSRVGGKLRHMGVSVSVLASGSRGNCALVATSTTRILLDAGLSGRETFKRLRVLGSALRASASVGANRTFPRS